MSSDETEAKVEETAAEKPEETKALAPQTEGGALAIQEVNFEEDAGLGGEDISANMKTIPFLGIIQSTSTYRKKGETNYIKECEDGEIILTTTKQRWAGEGDNAGVILVVAKIRPKSIEWTPREKGGGIVKVWGQDDSYKTMKGYAKAPKGTKVITPEGNEIIEYIDAYCILVDPSTRVYYEVVFSAKSTSIKPTKSLLTQLTSQKVESEKRPGKYFTPAMFYRPVRMLTTVTKNNEGSWYLPKFEVLEGRTVDMPNGTEIYLAAKKFYEAVEKDTILIDDRGREGAGSGEVGDEELPF